jgi:hypothetical protein
MDNLTTVAFEAHNEKNHHRRQVTVGRDLLDDWTVAIRYAGQGGHETAVCRRRPMRCGLSSRPAPPPPVGTEADRRQRWPPSARAV